MNGQNQWWSKWEFTVSHRGPGASRALSQEELKQNVGRFARKFFGEACQIRAKYSGGKLLIHVIAESASGVAHDPAYVEHVKTTWTAFMVAGFGPSTIVELNSRLISGSTQDGGPAEQAMILPQFSMEAPVNV